MVSRKAPAGKPFVKGDSRINRHGPVSRDRQAWAVQFNNVLATRADPVKLIDKLVTLAERGIEWAMKEVLDRTLGKVTQPVEGDHNVIFRIIYDKGIKDKSGADASR